MELYSSIFNSFRYCYIPYKKLSNEELFNERYFPGTKNGIKPIKSINNRIVSFLKRKNIQFVMSDPQSDINLLSNPMFSCQPYSDHGMRIEMPHFKNYNDRIFYYLAFFHEISHSIGFIKNGYTLNAHSYEIEELIAETTSVLMLKHFKIRKNIPTTSKIYLKIWMDYLPYPLSEDSYNNKVFIPAKKRVEYFLENA